MLRTWSWSSRNPLAPKCVSTTSVSPHPRLMVRWATNNTDDALRPFESNGHRIRIPEVVLDNLYPGSPALLSRNLVR